MNVRSASAIIKENGKEVHLCSTPVVYEQVINNALNRELAEIPEARKSTAPIDTAEAAKVLAQYLADVVQKRTG